MLAVKPRTLDFSSASMPTSCAAAAFSSEPRDAGTAVAGAPDDDDENDDDDNENEDGGGTGGVAGDAGPPPLNCDANADSLSPGSVASDGVDGGGTPGRPPMAGTDEYAALGTPEVDASGGSGGARRGASGAVSGGTKDVARETAAASEADADAAVKGGGDSAPGV